jgi:hypothetical protein
MGKETAFNLQEAVVRFRVDVIGAVGAGLDFVQFIRSGSVDEEANACLAIVFHVIRAQIVGRIEEGLGGGKGAVFRDGATEGLDVSTCCIRELRGVRVCVWGAISFRGEDGPYGCCVIQMVGEEGGELRGESV